MSAGSLGIARGNAPLPPPPRAPPKMRFVLVSQLHPARPGATAPRSKGSGTGPSARRLAPIARMNGAEGAPVRVNRYVLFPRAGGPPALASVPPQPLPYALSAARVDIVQASTSAADAARFRKRTS